MATSMDAARIAGAARARQTTQDAHGEQHGRRRLERAVHEGCSRGRSAPPQSCRLPHSDRRCVKDAFDAPRIVSANGAP